MRFKIAALIGYFSSSVVVFLANPYQIEKTDERVRTSLEWPLDALNSAYEYYLGHSLPDHFPISTVLPVGIFILIVALFIVLWFTTLPPVTPIERIIQRHADWTINNAMVDNSAAREIIFPQVVETESEKPSQQLNFKVRPSAWGDQCAICRSSVIQDHDYVSCPSCDTPFHYSHFAEWIKMKGFCPVCRKEIIAVSE